MNATRTLRADLLKGKAPLPSLPEVVREVLRLVNDADSGPDDFETLLRNDPPFVASLLRMANSPLMAIGRSITTIGEAVVVVGFQRLSRMALTIGARGAPPNLRRETVTVPLEKSCDRTKAFRNRSTASFRSRPR